MGFRKPCISLRIAFQRAGVRRADEEEERIAFKKMKKELKMVIKIS